MFVIGGMFHLCNFPFFTGNVFHVWGANQGFRLLADDVCHQMGSMQCHLCATKQAQKKSKKKVTTPRWQCWHDQLMMCFSLFFSEPICRCFKGILCFIQSSHATALSHIIVAMSSPARSRSPMREKACWLVNSFIPDSPELIVAVLWISRCLEHVAKIVKWSNWSCNASQLTFWSCKNYWSMVIHLFSHFTCPSAQFKTKTWTTHWDLKR